MKKLKKLNKQKRKQQIKLALQKPILDRLRSKIKSIKRRMKQFYLKKRIPKYKINLITEDLLKRFESFPKWKRLKDTAFNIDHIFPINAFFQHGIVDMDIINHLTNLQPLSERANNKKKDDYDKDEFYKYLKEQFDIKLTELD